MVYSFLVWCHLMPLWSLWCQCGSVTGRRSVVTVVPLLWVLLSQWWSRDDATLVAVVPLWLCYWPPVVNVAPQRCHCWVLLLLWRYLVTGVVVVTVVGTVITVVVSLWWYCVTVVPLWYSEVTEANAVL